MPQLVTWVVSVESHASKNGQASLLDVANAITTPALDFALLSLKLDPQAKVFINVSHPNRAEDLASLAKLTQAGATVGDATLASLQAVPAQLAAAGGDVLLIYWVGHGVMQERRLLVTADSHSADQLWALEVDGLLGHLRSQAQAALQLGFFECCAQVVSTAQNRMLLAQHEPTDRKQYYFFAASAGEVASAKTSEPGFTQSALAALRTVGWPLDPATLRSAFDAEWMKVPLQTRPTSLQWTDGSGDLWSSDGSSAASRRELETWARAAKVSVSEFLHLSVDARSLIDLPTLAQALGNDAIDKLLGDLLAANPDASSALKVKVVQAAIVRWRVVREVIGAAADLALYWRAWQRLEADELAREGRPVAAAIDLPGMLLELLDQTDDVRGQDSLIRVLEAASRRARPAAAKALRAAVAASPILGPRVGIALKELPPAQEALYLAAAVALPTGGVGVHVDAAWLLDGARREALTVPPAEEGLATQLNQLFDDAVTRAIDRPLVIELLVPSDLLCIPRRLLEFGNELLGVTMWLECQWPIVLRWRDRLDPKTGPRIFNSGRWKQQAQAAAAARGRNAPLALRFADAGPGQMAAELVALTFPGPTLEQPQRNRKAFFEAVLASHPYMCWPRDPVASDATFRARALNLVQNNPFDALAHALVKEKQGADATLHDLLLLIDEPKRNPLDGRLDEPAVAPAT